MGYLDVIGYLSPVDNVGAVQSTGGERSHHSRSATVEEIGGEIVFLHRIEEGAESSSYGVHVARLAGLPRQVTDRAGEILSRLESEGVKDFAG